MGFENMQVTAWCHHFIRQQVQEGDICIDATAGNGYDTLLLCRLTGQTGKVLAFDIQRKALDLTGALLKEHGYSARLIEDSHEHMDMYTEACSVGCIIFNFGYLPGGDHSISTHAESSMRAIEKGLLLLKPGGLMSLCIYSGGDSGYKEKESILQLLQSLSSKKYLVIVSSYYNRKNDPPVPVMVWKQK